MTEKRIGDVGEKRSVSCMLKNMTGWTQLVGGYGHDVAAIDHSLLADQLILINTDRTGLNIAFQPA